MPTLAPCPYYPPSPLTLAALAALGTQELRGGLPPLFLPPFLDATTAEWAPEKGALSHEVDREIVRYLADEARRHIVEEEPGWVGEYQGGGRGFGKFVNGDGSYMEGEFLNGQMVGIGKYVDPMGDSYTGEFNDPLLRGRRHGFGKQVHPLRRRPLIPPHTPLAPP